MPLGKEPEFCPGGAIVGMEATSVEWTILGGKVVVATLAVAVDSPWMRSAWRKMETLESV